MGEQLTTHKIAKAKIAAAIAIFAFGASAMAQPPSAVGIASVSEEGLSESMAETLRSGVSDELARLQVRLQANEPNQTPGTLTTTATELEGRFIAAAMRHMLVTQPHGQPVLIGIQGQVMENGARQLVLLNLSSWIDRGRSLDPNQSPAFAVLDDEKIRSPDGAGFQVEGVNYLVRAEGASIGFHRAP